MWQRGVGDGRRADVRCGGDHVLPAIHALLAAAAPRSPIELHAQLFRHPAEEHHLAPMTGAAVSRLDGYPPFGFHRAPFLGWQRCSSAVRMIVPSTSLTVSYPPLRPASAMVLVGCSCLLASMTPLLAAPYQQTLKLQGVTFKLMAVGEGSSQQLTVQAERDGKPLAQEQQKLDGTVVGAEVEDLNGDGLPELFIYEQSAGSGSYGSVWAWSVSRRGSLLPIRLGAMSSRDSSGYRGHDKFAVVESNLVRRFPIYLPGDSNASPSGGTRQVTYKLVPGGGAAQLQPVNSSQY
jgi:hypothetical protein